MKHHQKAKGKTMQKTAATTTIIETAPERISQSVTLQQMSKILNAIYYHERPLTVFTFYRETPKCPNCGKKSAKWVEGKDTYCPKCGATIAYQATKECYLDRIHLRKGYVKFIDMADWKRKTCLVQNILSVSYFDKRKNAHITLTITD